MPTTMRRTTALVPLFALGLSAAMAQQVPFTCANNDPDLFRQLHHDDPQALQRITEAEAELEAHTAAFQLPEGEREPYIITVVFHVIHDNGPENILDEQLYDAIRVLNDDFNKLNSDWPNVQPAFLDIVADVGIEFRLARKDPQGNCTNGITRTQSPLTYQGDYEMVGLINWPRDRYMNVWVAASANGAAGYTNYPSALHNFPQGDGIVMLHSYTGSIGTSSVNTSRTLTHEVGHWLNLRHAWGNSNNPGLPSNCNEDDLVADTPNTMGWTGCLLSGSTCDETQDNVENYMEYAYCSKMFTNGQKARMLAALNSNTAQRNQLWQPATLALTGVDQPAVLCMANLHGDRRLICAGESVQFLDQSYNGVVSRTWQFPGGDPATSTDQYPVVTYAVPGVYPVTLTVSDGSNSMEVTEANYVTVLAVPGQPAPFSEGFEHEALEDTPWMVTNPNGDNTWHLSGSAASTGAKSIGLMNTPGMSGRKDMLTSTTLDMSTTDPVMVSFRYAYARRVAGNDDRLRVYVSTNCGETWSLRKTLRGQFDLNTAGAPQGGSFVPSGPDQWQDCVVNNLSAMHQIPDLMVRFEFESDGGNNLYLDDINIGSQVVGVHEFNASGGAGLYVVPNPAHHQAQARLNVATAGMVRIELLDVTGRSIGLLHSGAAAVGPLQVDLPVAAITPGLYMVKVTGPGGSQVARLVKE